MYQYLWLSMIQPVQTNTCIIYLLKVKNKYKQISTEKKIEKIWQGTWCLTFASTGAARGLALIVSWHYPSKMCHFNMTLLSACKLCTIYFGYKIDLFWQSERIENSCISSTYLKKIIHIHYSTYWMDCH